MGLTSSRHPEDDRDPGGSKPPFKVTELAADNVVLWFIGDTPYYNSVRCSGEPVGQRAKVDGNTTARMYSRERHRRAPYFLNRRGGDGGYRRATGGS
ncbi:hypothetical protein DFR68_107302 [Nocardia mexicana]|uniref:Uncharacterized protein n=1 Tax=Nocardia mexicana TaxID=279262 RepID=A0A370GZR3_9NOCA|nr:hypothetical protein DFR68_107302 [Nocardia mexicana]